MAARERHFRHAARTSHHSQTQQTSKSGLMLGLSGSVGDAINNAISEMQATRCAPRRKGMTRASALHAIAAAGDVGMVAAARHVRERKMKTSVEKLFDVLLGQPTWSVRHTHGSCFFMEFGNPHRVMREPLPVRDGMSREQTVKRKSRKIFFRGNWSLLIYACNWSLQAWEFSANNNSTPSETALPFEALDGQYLKTVHYDALTRTTTLIFDLGAQLRLWPNEDADDHESQWSLCTIHGAYSSFILSGDIEVAAGDNV